MEIFLGWLIGSILVAVWYGQKGGGWFSALLLSLLLSPLIGFLFVALSHPGPKCPHCKETIKRGATVCPHCRTPLAAAMVEQPAE